MPVTPVSVVLTIAVPSFSRFDLNLEMGKRSLGEVFVHSSLAKPRLPLETLKPGTPQIRDAVHKQTGRPKIRRLVHYY